MLSEKTVLVTESAGVFTITLNRPAKRNALNPALLRELSAALDQAALGPCQVVIVTGSGSAFCAGMDLEQLETMATLSADVQRNDSRSFAELLRMLYYFPKPTIAAINGSAIAGGLGIASVCDFTLAVAEAKFGYTEARIGFIAAIVAPFLVRQVGEKRARDLLLTARIFTAEEALSYGLLTRIVTAASLEAETQDLAQRLLQNSPQSLSALKHLLREQGIAALETELELAVEANARQRDTADFKEGVRAFLEKRPPVWWSGKS